MEKLAVCASPYFIYSKSKDTQQSTCLLVLVLLKKIVKALSLSCNDLSLGIRPSSYIWAQHLKNSSHVDFESCKQIVDMS